MKNNTKNQDELDQIQEDLIREAEEKNKGDMAVSGKSVFDLKRLKEKRSDKKNIVTD